VFDWLEGEGFAPRRIACLPERPNVVATLRGSGGGCSLIFNSHIDTAISNDETAGFLLPFPRAIHTAWAANGELFGHAIINDRGPTAAWMIAAKALKHADGGLKGDLVLVAAVSETTGDPVDEFTSARYLGKEAGTRYTVLRGVVADYALVCEATDFSPVWVEAGEAYYKVRVHGGPPLYTPYVPRFTDAHSHPNAVVRAATVIQALAEWANRFEDAYRYECPGGVVVPKVNIGAVRGGVPYRIMRTLEFCDLYVDVRIPPETDPLIVRAEIERVLELADVEGTVELTTFRRGYEARGVEALAEAVIASHRQVRSAEPVPAHPGFSSMWRDLNVYNEVGIPAMTYGPAAGSGGGNVSMRLDDLVQASQVYALTALHLCNRDKSGPIQT
jgi:acetylornithine deacetylase/succinyl-diaminopimelate desuccinylase-like protein